MTGGATIQSVAINTQISRPAVRYHGGKYLLGPWVISHFPDHRIFADVCGGGANVLLRKPRTYSEIYNDVDRNMVNFFTVYRDRKDELKQALIDTPFAREEFILSYEPTEDPLELARRTAVRSFMGFGSASIGTHYQSGFRSDCKKSGSTAAMDWSRYPKAMDAIASRLRGVVIENLDFRALIPQHDTEDTLYYVDPPYELSTRNTRHAYKHEFTIDDHCEMAALLHSIQGMCVISGYDCDLYDWLYRDWESDRIASHADGASDRIETVWLNPACSEKLHREPRLL